MVAHPTAPTDRESWVSLMARFHGSDDADVAIVEAALRQARARHGELVAELEMTENGIRLLLRALTTVERVAS